MSPAVAPQPFPTGTSTVLTGADAMRLARPCSGISPGAIDGEWTPSPSQIDELEYRLPAVFEDHRREAWPDLSDRASDYYRQYAGLIIDGQHAIYVQGIFRSAIERDRIIDRRRPELTWRDAPIWICDAGPTTFDAVYDVRRRQFVSFAFGHTLARRISP